MKYLFVAPRFHINLHFRIKSLKDGGDDVYLFSLYKQSSECYDSVEPIIIKSSFLNGLIKRFVGKKYNNNFWKIKLNIPNRKNFKNNIKNINPDVVIIKNLQSAFSLMALWYARKFTDKVFILIQTDKHYVKKTKKRILIWFLRKIFKVKGIITPLKNALNQKDNFFVYIPFVIEYKDFEKKYFKDNKINIISVGKYVERKDHLTLIKAVERLRDKFDIRLTLVGEKTDEKIRQDLMKYIEDNNLKNSVEVKYNIEYKEMLANYKNYDLFVLPSYNEPAAYSIIEAMANKLPVICSDTCGTKCYIEEEKNGYIFKSRDYKDLTEKINKTIYNDKNILTMGQKSFELIQFYYSSQVFRDKFKKLIK